MTTTTTSKCFSCNHPAVTTMPLDRVLGWPEGSNAREVQVCEFHQQRTERLWVETTDNEPEPIRATCAAPVYGPITF